MPCRPRGARSGRTADAERLYAEATARMMCQGSPHAHGFKLIATATIRAGQGRLAAFLPQARKLFDGYGPMAADLLAAALAAAGQPDEARRILAQAMPIRPDCFFKVFATFRTTAMVALGETKGAEKLYASLLPHRDAPLPTSGFTVALRPVAYTLGELAVLLGRDDEAAAHFTRAAIIAERWNSSSGLTRCCGGAAHHAEQRHAADTQALAARIDRDAAAQLTRGHGA